MTGRCTAKSTWGQFGTPVCSCRKCSDERDASMRRVLTRGIKDGPDLDWDYEKKNSYTNAELGE